MSTQTASQKTSSYNVSNGHFSEEKTDESVQRVGSSNECVTKSDAEVNIVSIDNQISLLQIETNDLEPKGATSYESCLEMLPNELFLIIFSDLGPDDIFQAFFDLNQRFKLLILQLTRHLKLPADFQHDWIVKYMLYIESNIETIELDGHYVPFVFSDKYSYSNLRSIIISSNDQYPWQIELEVENKTPLADVISALNVLYACCFDIYPSYFPSVYEKVANHAIFYQQYRSYDDAHGCSAIKRVRILECGENLLFWLCALAPRLTCLELSCLYPSASEFDLATPIARISTPVYLTDLTIKMQYKWRLSEQLINGNIEFLINTYRLSLKRITLDFNTNTVTDGQLLESLLTSCVHLEKFSFISRWFSKEMDVRNLLQSFRSEWWLDTHRPPVLMHKNSDGDILIASMPCSTNFLFVFSTDRHAWHLNKERFDSSLIHFDNKPKLCIANVVSFSLPTVKFIAHLFATPNQMLWCTNWELTSAEELFEQLMNKTMMTPVLSNVTRLVINHANGLNAWTLAVWLLLAPNVRMLTIEPDRTVDTDKNQVEWLNKLDDALRTDKECVKTVFKRVKKIKVLTKHLDVYYPRRTSQVRRMLDDIFPEAIKSCDRFW